MGLPLRITGSVPSRGVIAPGAMLAAGDPALVAGSTVYSLYRAKGIRHGLKQERFSFESRP